MTARRPFRGGLGLAAGFLWCAVAVGCAGLVLEPDERVPTRALTAAALADKVWTARPGPCYVRQTALFEAGDNKLAADGLLRYDPAAGAVRLVAVNEAGVKLFDLTVTRDAVTENFVLPELAAARGLPAAVGACLRAVFLAYEPRAGDRLDTGPETYELSRPEGDGRLLCVFGGRETLLYKHFEGAGQSWTVRFFDYAKRGAALLPGRTVFTDRRAGYRVSLWLEEVKEAHD